MRTVNSKFESLARLGSRNHRNRFEISTSDVTDIGVSVEQAGAKKATTVEVLLPGRTLRGSRRVARAVLNGHQARELFEALRTHYESR